MADNLVCFTPKRGDGVFLPAGTVHSLGDDVVVFEVQQNSDVTFRLYDWGHVDAETGHPRVLQVDQALACVNFADGAAGLVTPVVEATTPVERERRFHCEHFWLWRLRGDSPFTVGAAGVCCSCPQWSERVFFGQAVQRTCWKLRYRNNLETGNSEMVGRTGNSN
jgi:mannose-6-phosphate isomerase